MVGAIARHDPALRPAARLPREFYRVLVGIRAAQGEEHPAALKSGELQQLRGQCRARLRAPGRVHETQGLRLFLNGANHARMLMPEVHAFGQAAHIEEAVSRLIPECAPCPPTMVGASHSACTHQLCNTLDFFRDSTNSPQSLIRGCKAITICAMRSVNNYPPKIADA